MNNLLFKSDFPANIFTITKYEGFSPDVNSEGTHPTRRGFDQNTYPPARVITIGIKADF